MVFDITHLKKIRKQLGLTQHQFAQRASISQSMVAKIESGKLDPTYSYVQKIEQTLQTLNKQEEKEAYQIMHKKVITVSPKEKVSHAIRLLTQHNISQIPILQGTHIVGLISESSLLNHAQEDAEKLCVNEVMLDSPPTIARSTKQSVIIALLKFYPILIVQEKGKMCGVITKADLIKHMS